MPEPAVQPIERIALIGFMGAGKSTVARELAAALSWECIDLDAEIEAATGQSVPEIFAERGEAGYRCLEQQLTTALASKRNVVFAVGGGWVTRPETVAALPATTFFWLVVSPDEALGRVRAQGQVRPMLQRPDPLAAARELEQQRKHVYAALGEPVATDGRTPGQVVQDILRKLGRRGFVPGRGQEQANGSE